MSTHVVLTTFGSFGDLHPYIAIALELQKRGHRATIATSALYRDKVESLGLGFHAVRPDLPDPKASGEIIRRVMDLRSGGEYLFREMLMPHLRESYDDLLAITREADLLVTHPVTFAAPLVAQTTQVRWVSTVLAPISFFSAFDPPVPPSIPEIARLYRLGPVARRALFVLMRRITREWLAPVDALRRELGLSNETHPLFEGQHSPHCVLALFSGALGEKQRDWPANTRITGFAFYDRKGAMRLAGGNEAETAGEDADGLSRELEHFLSSGPPPLVFTLGSAAVMNAGRFYRESARAARRLRQRAVLLVGEAANTPRILPPNVMAFDYAPYSLLFPRACAVIHQGGIGTTAQALRAGVPQLVMPYSHDQPDNAARIVRLGVGRQIARKRYDALRAARDLQLLLRHEYSSKAFIIGERVRREDGTGAACDAIEEQLRAS